MNKNLLLLSTLLLPLCAQNKPLSAPEKASLNDTIIDQFKAQLSTNLQLSTDVTFHYDSYIPKLSIVDQISNDYRTNYLVYERQIIQELYVKKDQITGNACEQYLTISNTVESRTIEDASGNPIIFDNGYASPFTRLTKIKNESFTKYFTISKIDTGYQLTATEYAYGILSQPLLSFYFDYDILVWDGNYSRSVSNLLLNIDNNGLLTSFSFDKIKKDIYGGIKETYIAKVKTLNNISCLTPLNSSLTQEQQDLFDTKMASFQELLNKGNFSQCISIAPNNNKNDNNKYEYHNYYAFNSESFIPAMICSAELIDQSYGKTFISVLDDGDSYASFGISPDADYHGSINDFETYDLTAIIPQVNKISSSLFSYNESNNQYTLNFDKFMYDDTHFCSSLLIALFGNVDPSVHNLGLYSYDGYSYYFRSLTLGFDDNNYLFGSLIFNYYGTLYKCEFDFSNVGTTNLLTLDDISEVVNYIKN